MKVKFLPMNVEHDILPGQSVMSLAHDQGIHVSSVCNGMPSCAECRVRVVENDHNVMPPSVKELALIGTGYFLDQRRLSCQLTCFGDITVDLTEQIEKANESKVNKKFLKKAQKESPEKSHSVGGVLIEQDDEIKNLKAEPIEPEVTSTKSDASSPRGENREPSKKKRRRRRQPS